MAKGRTRKDKGEIMGEEILLALIDHIYLELGHLLFNNSLDHAALDTVKALMKAIEVVGENK